MGVDPDFPLLCLQMSELSTLFIWLIWCSNLPSKSAVDPLQNERMGLNHCYSGGLRIVRSRSSVWVQ